MGVNKQAFGRGPRASLLHNQQHKPNRSQSAHTLDPVTTTRCVLTTRPPAPALLARTPPPPPVGPTFASVHVHAVCTNGLCNTLHPARPHVQDQGALHSAAWRCRFTFFSSRPHLACMRATPHTGEGTWRGRPAHNACLCTRWVWMGGGRSFTAAAEPSDCLQPRDRVTALLPSMQITSVTTP